MAGLYFYVVLHLSEDGTFAICFIKQLLVYSFGLRLYGLALGAILPGVRSYPLGI